MDVKLLSGALGAEISGIDLKDASLENFKYPLLSSASLLNGSYRIQGGIVDSVVG